MGKAYSLPSRSSSQPSRGEGLIGSGTSEAGVWMQVPAPCTAEQNLLVRCRCNRDSCVSFIERERTVDWGNLVKTSSIF